MTALALVWVNGCGVPETEEIEVQNAGLQASNWRGSNWRGSNWRGSNWRGSNWRGSNWRGSNWRGSNWRGSNWRGSNWRAAGLPNASDGSKPLGDTGSVNGGALEGGDSLALPDKTGSCVAPELNSITFAELLSEQTPASKIHVVLGKLSGGVSSEPDGPVDANVWKMVVRGDRTACSFFLTAPLGTNWHAMAGAMKAIFYWTAPRTQVMEVSGIEASRPFDPTMATGIITYTGMMDTAAKWRTGQISEKSFVAGELAFTAATTNNRSVVVDFASWVMDSSGKGLILAQVESVDSPTFAESVYYAYENGDGSIGVAVGPASWVSGAGKYSETVASSYETLESAFRFYQAGLLPKPQPTRCGGALFLNAKHGQPMPTDQCDSWVSWVVSDVTGNRAWDSEPNTTAPMNQYMWLPLDGNTPLKRNGKVVLSETYVHMWEPNYDYAVTTGAAGLREKHGALLKPSTDLGPSMVAGSWSQ